MTNNFDAKTSTIKHSAKLPYGYRVTFSFITGGFTTEFEPSHPCILNPSACKLFRKAYTKERNEFVELVASQTKCSILIAEYNRSNPKITVIHQPTEQ